MAAVVAASTPPPPRPQAKHGVTGPGETGRTTR